MLSDGRHSYIHKYESNASMLSRVIFYLKSVNFLFWFSISTGVKSKHAKQYVICAFVTERKDFEKEL